MAKELHQEKVVRLLADRSDPARGPLLVEDRLAILIQMRDDSLCWAAECARDKQPKGSASAIDLYAFACDEVQKDALAGTMGAVSNGLSIAGLDPTLILVNGTGERIEA